MISEQHLSEVFESLPDAAVVVEHDGTIALVNARTEKLFGYDRRQLIGQTVETLIPEPTRSKHVAQREQYFSNPYVRPMGGDLDLVGRRSDGTVFPVDVSLSPLRLEGRVAAIASIRDISNRKQTELRLRNALAEVQRLKDRLEVDNVYLREEIKSDRNFDEIVGKSDCLKSVLREANSVAATDTTVLILGETGTGKELLARAIHGHSPRNGRPLVRVNCSALPATLIESELFGHEKGAFTGAIVRQRGRFEVAHGGTIFLDEIGELEQGLQSKLLRVLEEGEFERLGSHETVRVDVRVISATNRDLEKALREGSFRRDLYHRLSVFPLDLPPLRERGDDIAILLWFFIKKHERRLGKTIDKIPQQDMDALLSYSWPGNVRELENVVERGMILSHGSTLKLERAFGRSVTRPPVVSGVRSLREIERDHILKVIEECGWKLKGEGNAAARLGMKPSTLRHRLRKLGIERPGSRF